MVEVGSLEIVGKIDTSSIDAGLAQLGRGLDTAKSKAKDAFGDMERLSGTLEGIGKKLGRIAVGASASFLGLAALGPAVAPSLARIEMGFFEMTRTISEALAPSFEMFADMFEGFVGWLGSEEGRGVLEGVNNVLGNILSGAESALKGLNAMGKSITTTFDFVLGSGVGNDLVKGLLKVGAFPAIATLLGGPFAGLGALGLQSAGGYSEATEQGNVEGQQAQGGLLGVAAGGLTGAALGSIVPGVGTLIGGILGAGFGGATGMLMPGAMNTDLSGYNSGSVSSQRQKWFNAYGDERDFNLEQSGRKNFEDRNLG